MRAVAAYPALEAFGDAGTPEGALRLLNELVLPSGLVAEDVTVEDVSHIPGRVCTACYMVRFDDGAAPRRVTATFAKDDRLATVFAEHYGGGDGRIAGDAERPVALVPERRCLVEFFGMDWRLPALAAATDPDRIGPVLARLGCRPPVEVAALRYRPHQRCVLQYTAAAGRRVIGKVYRDPADAARVWETARGVHAEGVVIAQPLALVEETLLLSERVEGCSWLQALVGARRPGRMLTAAAAVAARLHALPAPSGAPHTFGSELAKLRARIARMAPAAPGPAAEATALLDSLCRDPAGAGGEDATALVHGDFKPDQLLLSGEGIAVLDFDRVGRGDPAVDIGNFVAQLHREALVPGRENLRALVEPFLAEYERVAGAPDVAVRARCFRTLALVRMAVRRFVHSPNLYARGGAPSRPEPLLAEAASCLD